MTRRDRDLKRLLVGIAAQANAQLVKFQRTGSGHQRAVFVKPGAASFHLIAASSPSDHRSGKNMIAFARRRLRT